MAAKNDDDLLNPYMSGRALAAALATGLVTSVAATKFFIRRIQELDGKTNLVVLPLFEDALARAAQADAALARGETWGPLHGVPLTIKENYAMVGVQTTCGMKLYTTLDNGKPYRPKVNAAVVDRLLNAGAIILAKTNLPEEAADFQSYNSVYGTSRNPWDLARTPGGSSGGSAGALAAGFTPFEVGSDIGGSIRTPAHFSGVCGHKPTQGAVDKFGFCPPFPLSLYQEDLAVAGPLARSCADLELMMEILAGPDPVRAAGGWRLELPPPRVKLAAELRVAVWADDPFCECDAEYVAAIRACAASLAAAGATVDYTARPVGFEESFNLYAQILAPSMAGKAVAPRMQSKRRKLQKRWAAFFARGYDVLLCPVAPCAAIPIDESGGLAGMATRTITVNGDGARPYMELIKWAGLTIVVDLPVTVVPIDVLGSSGLPVGVQIVAPLWEDRTALRVGSMIERLHPSAGTRVPPGYAADPAAAPPAAPPAARL